MKIIVVNSWKSESDDMIDLVRHFSEELYQEIMNRSQAAQSEIMAAVEKGILSEDEAEVLLNQVSSFGEDSAIARILNVEYPDPLKNAAIFTLVIF
jgi:uncharacterized membrane protein YebE (DUF533 family)